MHTHNKFIDVGIICFNHENFIRECIESVFQQTAIDLMRVIVIDDGSTDSTPDILKSLCRKFNFKLILHESNEGILRSAKALFDHIQSPYFTWMDGDDYWTYDKKIETQINFLTEHPEYNACFHDAEIIQKNNAHSENIHRTQYSNRYYSQFNTFKEEIYPGDLIRRTILPTASVVFRKQHNTEFIDRIDTPYSLAWQIQLEYIADSKFYFFNHIWSAYRDHPGGFSKRMFMKDFKLTHIQILKSLLKHPGLHFHKTDIYESLSLECKNLLYVSQKEPIENSLLKKTRRDYKKYSRLAVKSTIHYTKQP